MKIIVAPASGSVPKIHLRDTVENSIKTKNLNLGGTDLGLRLSDSFKAWGFSEKFKNQFKNIQVGDYLTFYQSKKLTYVAEIINKIVSQKLSNEIWSHSNNESNWPLILILSNVKRINVPVQAINERLGYKEKNVFQGAVFLDEKKSAAILPLIEEIFDDAIINDEEVIKLQDSYKKLEITKNGSQRQPRQFSWSNEQIEMLIVKKNIRDFNKENIIKEKIGVAAETLVIKYLKENYEFDNIKLMRDSNNTTPFDIVCTKDSFKTFIEVKGTKSDSIKTDFYMSANEYEFAKHCLDNNLPYKLIRVIDVALHPKIIELDVEDIFNPENDFIESDTYRICMSQYDTF